MQNISLLSRKKSSSKAGQLDSQIQGWSHLQAVVDFLVMRHGWIIISLGIIMILLLGIDHIDTVNHLRNFHSFFVFDVILIILILGTIWFLTRWLLLALAERSRVINILRLKNEVSANLSASRDIPELSKRVVQQTASIFPFVDIELYLYEKNRNWFARATYQDNKESTAMRKDAAPEISPYPCRSCLATNNIALHPLASCRQDGVFWQTHGMDGFCLPLIDGIWPVGLLQLYPMAREPLGADQIELLENISADFARAIGAVIEEKARNENTLTQKIYAMQLDIARDLHDTVGQNIGYLRMKLDHLSEMDPEKQTDLKIEVGNMSKVANESYDLIRGTLAVLQSENSADLFRLFTRYAEQVEERSAFKMDFSSQGEPKLMSAKRMRQLFYIFREIMNNVEKHANASQVSMEMTWDENYLTIVVFDNGNGFDLDKVQYGSHYGLKFMRERIELLNGSLSVHSTVGSGTEILIQMPYDQT